MSQEVISLWAPEIKPKILSPLSILKNQGQALAHQTGGVLVAEVGQEETLDGKLILSFDMVAPALQGSRHRLMKVAYHKDMPYPAIVDAAIFSNTLMSMFLKDSISRKEENRADTDEEFIKIVARVLRSQTVLSIAQSLLARANEVLTTSERPNEDT